MAKLKTERDIQNEAIRSICGALAESMVLENNWDDGGVFKSLKYGDKTITAEERATAVAAQCFNKLANSSSNLDLIEVLLVKAIMQKGAIKVFEVASAEYEAEQKKLAREKELVARAKVAATDPEVKRTRKARISKNPAPELPITSGVNAPETNTVSVIGRSGSTQDPFTELDGKLDTPAKEDFVPALSALSGLDDGEPTL